MREKNGRTEIKAIRQRPSGCQHSAEEENMLQRRAEHTLHHLLTYRDTPSATSDLMKHLEAVTRLSPLCCENVAESGAASTIFDLCCDPKL